MSGPDAPEADLPVAPADAGIAGTRRRAHVRLKVFGGFVILAAAAWFLATVGEPPQPGAQADPVQVGLSLAESDGWAPLVPLSGKPRAGFPEPMVWRGDEVCIGFSRVDFGPEHRRPTLARCLSRATMGALRPNEILTMAVVVAGPDTWHFIEAAGPLAGIRVDLEGAGGLSGDRISVADTMFVLRLPNRESLDTLEWSTTDGEYRCEPNPDAWETSIFCPSG